MDNIRPLKSLFHPAIFFSIVGQAAIHIYCMVEAVTMAKDSMGEDALKRVMAFHKKVRAGETENLPVDEDDPLAEVMALWSQPFLPNLLNSVIFLVETAQIIAVLFVNYKGRPWMVGVLENHPLFLSIFACIGGVAFCAWEVVPTLSSSLNQTGARYMMKALQFSETKHSRGAIHTTFMSPPASRFRFHRRSTG
jgi:cation-transporting ATPase 13A1